MIPSFPLPRSLSYHRMIGGRCYLRKSVGDILVYFLNTLEK